MHASTKARHRKQSRHQSSVLELPPRRSHRIVVVADTHGRPHPASAAQIERLEPDAILHAGDIGSFAVIDMLKRIAPTFAVRGNVDGHHPSTPDSLDLGLRREGRPALCLLLTHVAVYGPKLMQEAASLARQCSASLVVCGHSHVPFIGRDRGLVVFNPGSIGPRRFGLPITFGVMELGDGEPTLRHVSAETGETWTP